MKLSNEELVYSARDAISSIEMAQNELEAIEEYKEVYEALNEIIDMLQEKSEEYEEKYNEEMQDELDYQNSEYERSAV